MKPTAPGNECGALSVHWSERPPALSRPEALPHPKGKLCTGAHTPSPPVLQTAASSLTVDSLVLGVPYKLSYVCNT